MQEEAFETVRLSRAARGHDLWSAVEASQFARIDHADEFEAVEAEAADAFLGALNECAEEWEEGSTDQQMAALGTLGRQLGDLAAKGVFVHTATVERVFDSEEIGAEVEEPGFVRLPVAIVWLGRSRASIRTLMLPHEIAADDDE